VATVEKKETDLFTLCLTQIRAERLQPRDRKVIHGSRSDLLPTVFQKLVDNNILSMPVVNKKGKFSGVIDMLDIVRFIISLFDDIANTSLIDLETLFASDAKFSKTRVSEIIPYPYQRSNPFNPITKGYSLFASWEVLALSGIHRVPIISESGEIVDIVTQSMLVDFLWQNLEKIGKLAEKQVKDMKSQHTNFIIQRTSTKAIVAFKEMVDNNVDHVAVVNEKGMLVENLSARDLRGIRPDVKVFYRLWSSIAEFKAKAREEFPDRTPATVLYALPSHTLYQVIETMALKHVHHVYVVDDEKSMKPIRVITQTDILREMLDK